MGDHPGVHRTCTARDDHRERAGVVTALDGDVLRAGRHLQVDQLVDPGGGLDDVQPEWLGHGAHGRLGEVGVQALPPTEEVVRIEVAEYQICIRHGGFGPAAAVRRWAGDRAGTARPHLEQAALVDPGDRPAARTDRVHVCGGQGDHLAVDLSLPADLHPAVQHEGGVVAGAAHVDDRAVPSADAPDEVERGDRTGRRTGQGDRRGQMCDGLGPGDTAVGLHHHQGAGEPAPGEPADDLGHVALHDGAEVGVHHGRADPRVQPDLGQYLRREREERPRRPGLYHLPGAQLVFRVGIGVREADGDRLDPAVDQAGHGAAQRLLVEFLVDLAGRGHALLHHDPTVPRDEGVGRNVLVIVEVLAAADSPSHLEDVPQSCRGHQTGARTAAGEHRVGGDRRPVHDQVHRCQELGLTHPLGLGELGQPGEDTGRRIGRDRGSLVLPPVSGVVGEQEVGEGAADVDTDGVPHLSAPARSGRPAAAAWNHARRGRPV
ncbi:hypothetical protein SAMN05216207_103942 [Pseudonocardia ammonioxydans]|uniref:Uncharacterized protein n=1 Tax=Pseudonocardia ammonioxydans TaxID=260086 RepID=A0A1I5FNC6_PSUAM|nr:hypothetical protein SAMN05216207_103942 [Pseudonocardia ammonioxydans]